jgi:hypothetical protein
LGNYTRRQTEKLIKRSKNHKDLKIKGRVIHILMWLAYRFDLAEGEMLNLKIKDVFHETNGKLKIKNLTIPRKTAREKPTPINVNFNADAKLKLEAYYKYLQERKRFKVTKRDPLFPGLNRKCYCSKTLYRHVRELGRIYGAPHVTLKEIRKSKFKKKNILTSFLKASKQLP